MSAVGLSRVMRSSSLSQLDRRISGSDYFSTSNILPISRLFIMNVRRGSGISYDSVTSQIEKSPNSIVFLHGILGNKRNWRSACNEFVRRHPTYNALAIDLRGHGQTSVSDRNHTLESCGRDLQTFLWEKNIGGAKSNSSSSSSNGNNSYNSNSDILCGHSFGGKVVLKFAELQEKENHQRERGVTAAAAAVLPKDIWILDSLPGLYKSTPVPNEQSVFDIINTLLYMPQQFESSDWALKYLVSKDIPKPIASWLCTSIVDDDEVMGRKKFSFDIHTVHALFNSFCETDMWPYLEDYSGDANIHYLRAGNNKAWTPEVLARFDYVCKKSHGKIQLHTMSGVGHWLHAENLRGTLDFLSHNSQALRSSSNSNTNSSSSSSSSSAAAVGGTQK